MYINYYYSSGIEYAKVSESVRENGKVRKTVNRYLGRVIDREKGIFRNREYGLYSYDLETDQIRSVDPEDQPSAPVRKNDAPRRRTLGLPFGDVFLITEFLKTTGLKGVIDSIPCRNMDTLYSLVLYCTASAAPYRFAASWWEMSCARLLFPGAQLDPQGIREVLEAAGEEEVQRAFFAACHALLSGRGTDGCMLTCTAGIPAISRLPCTAVLSPGGEIREDIRLICAVEQSTGLPLFFRLVPGRGADAFAAVEAVTELEEIGVHTSMVLLDAGYYNPAQADALHEAGIPFIAEIVPGHRIFREAVRKHGPALRDSSSSFVYAQKRWSAVETECRPGGNEDLHAYGYLFLDKDMRRMQEAAEDGDTDRDAGVFLLASTRKLSPDTVLSLFCTCGQVKEVFEISAQPSREIPFQVQTEQVLRGHLLLTFISAVFKRLLSAALEGSGYTAERVLACAHNLQCLVYGREAIVNEVPRQVSEPFEKLGIRVPDTVPVPKPPKL